MNFKLKLKIPYDGTANKVTDDLNKGIAFSDLDTYISELMLSHFSLMPLFLNSIKSSGLILTAQTDEIIITISSPSMASFVGISTETNVDVISSEFHLHQDALLFKERGKLKIMNPYSLASVEFSSSLKKFQEIYEHSPELRRILSDFKLSENAEKNSDTTKEVTYEFLEDLFLANANETSFPLDYDKYYALVAKYQKKHASFPFSLSDIRSLDLGRALFERKSRRESTAPMKKETVEKLLQLVFSELPEKRRLYLSAGAMYEIFPIIQIHSAEFSGLKQGTYHYNQTDGHFKLISTDASSHFAQHGLNPQVSISLISTIEIPHEKYGPLGLKLSLMNAGVILAYLSIFASALELNSCAFGKNCLSLNVLEKGQKELAAFCLF